MLSPERVGLCAERVGLLSTIYFEHPYVTIMSIYRKGENLGCVTYTANGVETFRE